MSDTPAVSFHLNGVEVNGAADASLLQAVRAAGATSVKDGCSPQGQCGCCTVLVDGDARVACVTPVARVAGRRVTTVRGLEPTWRDAAAAALVATGGSQCGFCTPGFVMSLSALLHNNADAGEESIQDAIAGNLCRCTGYINIVKAVKRSVELMK